MRLTIPTPAAGGWSLLFAFHCCLPAAAYQASDSARWSTTALSGGGLSQGDATTLTWGLVDDGVTITGSEGSSGSDLISSFNSAIGSSTVWMPLFDDAFERWGEISGLTLIHEESNSSSAIDNTTTPSGSANSVPDIRIGGHSIDGSSGSNVLAYNYFPNHGDMVIDTDNSSYFSNTSNNYRRLRNTLMHEIGHGLGISHMDSSDENFLLEPSLNTSFDGPQFDDILAAQRLYGDAWEKNGGNDTYTNATDLGTLTNSTTSIGADAVDAFVGANDMDFISIDDNSDTDFFSITVDGATQINLTLTPLGPTYNEGPQDGTQTSFDASAESDLTLRLLDTDGGTTLQLVNETGAGDAETLDGYFLPAAGTYYVQVTGADNAAQFYQLDAVATVSFLPGDVNLDGILSTGSGDPVDDDIAAFVAGWGTVLPSDDDETAWMTGDLNLDRENDLLDWYLLREAFLNAGAGSVSLELASAAPEPTSLALVFMAGAGWLLRSRRYC